MTQEEETKLKDDNPYRDGILLAAILEMTENNNKFIIRKKRKSMWETCNIVNQTIHCPD